MNHLYIFSSTLESGEGPSRDTIYIDARTSNGDLSMGLAFRMGECDLDSAEQAFQGALDKVREMKLAKAKPVTSTPTEIAA